MLNLRRRAAELATAVLLIAAIVCLFVDTFSFPPSATRGYPGAAFMPRVVLVCTAFVVVVWLIRTLGHKTKTPEGGESFAFQYRAYISTLGGVLAFVVALDWVGFEISCFALFVAYLVPRVSSVWAAVLASALATLVLYAVFVLILGVSLPLLFLPEYVAL